MGNPAMRDTLVVSALQTRIRVVAGLVCFSMLSVLAHGRAAASSDGSVDPNHAHPCFQALQTFVLQNANATVTFQANPCDHHLWLESIEYLAGPGGPFTVRFAHEPLWRIILKDFRADAKYPVEPSTFPMEAFWTQVNASAEALTAQWRGIQPGAGHRFTVQITAVLVPETATIRWAIQLVPDSMPRVSFWNVEYPILAVKELPDEDVLVHPVWGGEGVFHPTSLPTDAQLFHVDDELAYVPGLYPLQLMIYYSKTQEQMLYLHARDREGAYKQLPVEKRPAPDGDALVLSVRHWPRDNNVPNVGYLSYEVDVGVLRGDWQDAAEVYRQWAFRQWWTSHGLLETRSEVPARVKNAAIRAVGVFSSLDPRQPPPAPPVTEDIAGLVRAWRQRLQMSQSPWMVHAWNWQADGPDLRAHCASAMHYGRARPGVREQVDAIRNAGNLVGPYYNALYFSRGSAIYQRWNLEEAMVHDERHVIRLSDDPSGGCPESALLDPDAAVTPLLFHDLVRGLIALGFTGGYFDVISGGVTEVELNYQRLPSVGHSADPAAHARGRRKLFSTVAETLQTEPATSGNFFLYSEYPSETDLSILHVASRYVANLTQTQSAVVGLFEYVYGGTQVIPSSWHPVVGPIPLAMAVALRHLPYVELRYRPGDIPPTLTRFVDAVGSYARLRVNAQTRKYLEYGTTLKEPSFDTETSPATAWHPGAILYSRYAPQAVPLVIPTVVKASDGSLGIVLFNWKGPTPPPQPVSTTRIRVRIDPERYQLERSVYALSELTETARRFIRTADLTQVLELDVSVPELQTKVFVLERVGTIGGTITDQQTAASIGGALVVATPGSFTTRTSSTGRYALSHLPPGSYTLTVQATGYQAASRANVQVLAGQMTTANVTLVPRLTIAMPSTAVIGTTITMSLQGPPNTKYLLAYSGSALGFTVPRAGGGTITIPLTTDSIFFSSITSGLNGLLMGYRDTLNGQGQAPTRLKIPSEPHLAGKVLYVAFVTYNASGVLATSPAYQLTIR